MLRVDYWRVEKMMRRTSRYTFAAMLFLILVIVGAVSATAQVKRVQMHIGGYLCGN